MLRKPSLCKKASRQPSIAHKRHHELSEQRLGAPLYLAPEGLTLGLSSNSTGWQWNTEHQFSLNRYY